jgi:hypothetical protein
MAGAQSPVQRYLAAQALIGQMAGSATVRPLLIPATVPEYATDAANPFVAWPDSEYLGRAATIMRADTTRFPHLIDIRQLMGARTDQASSFAWGVHLTPTGAELIGQWVGAYLATLNTCATGSDAARSWAVQKYCRNSTGTFSSTICTTSGNCSGTQTCQARPCTTDTDCPDAGDSCHRES